MDFENKGYGSSDYNSDGAFDINENQDTGARFETFFEQEMRLGKNTQNKGYSRQKSVDLEFYSSKKNADKSAPKKSADNANQKSAGKSNRLIIAAVSAVLIVAVLCGAAFGIMNSSLFKNRSVDSDETSDFEDIITSSSENVTYFLVCGVDLSENLTDIIMVVCFDHLKNKVNVLQIPRDSYVGPEYKLGKINAVYESARDGESRIKALIRCINRDFGLPIDHYATFTIDGAMKIIDIAGGVDIVLDRDFLLVDDSGEQDVSKYFEAGNVHFDGQWATAFVRHRASYDAGDVQRVRAQRKFYAAFLKKMLSLDLNQMLKIVSDCSGDVSTDLTLGEMLGFAKELKELSLSDVSIVTVPGESDEYYAPTGYASYFSIYPDELCELLNEQFRPYEDGELSCDDLDIPELALEHSGDYDALNSGGTLDDFDTEKDAD